MEKLMTLNYWVMFEGEVVLYAVHGVVDFVVSLHEMTVKYDNSYPLAGMQFPIYGKLVKIELVEEV